MPCVLVLARKHIIPATSQHLLWRLTGLQGAAACRVMGLGAGLGAHVGGQFHASREIVPYTRPHSGGQEQGGLESCSSSSPTNPAEKSPSPKFS